MRICLFEDRATADLYPLTLTRPASDLLCGLTPLGEKQARYFGAEIGGYLCRPALAAWLQSREPTRPTNDPVWLRLAPTVLVNSRWLPPRSQSVAVRELFDAGPCLGTVNGEIAFALLEQDLLAAVSPTTLEQCLRQWAVSLPGREVGGSLISRAWELIEHNAEELIRDFDAVCDSSQAGYHPSNFTLIGRADRLFIHPTAQVEPQVVADTTRGPVVIGEGAIISAFTRLEGPCGIGSFTQVMSAQVRGGTTIGPRCRIGGELECSIMLGNSQKHHSGYLGHSYLGEWVHLAADTNTADQRYDYRPIRVSMNGEAVATDQVRLGSLIGDHTTTGVGVMLDCGSVVGAFAQVEAAGTFVPRDIPSFHRVGPEGTAPLDLNRLMSAAETMMQRRGAALSMQQERMYRMISAALVGDHVHAPATLPLRRSA